MNLIIVESPTKARTLSRFLGEGYAVEATMGHIKDLPKSPISVDIENDFAPDYKLVERQGKTVAALRKASKKAKEVYLATDPDREGEAIARHVVDVIGNPKSKVLNPKNIKRIVFHEITKTAVEEAMGNPRKVDENLVQAQIARRVLDRVVGYKLSPILWKKIRRGLSAGRVQTVAVRLIVEKEREIDAFKPMEYWEIYCDVNPEGKKKDGFIVRLVKEEGKGVEVKNEKQAKEIVKGLEKAKYEVTKVKRKEVKRRPYAPFTTSTLTQAGARVFGWSAKKTMSVAQKLYEEGLITYHRTDSPSLAKSAVNSARSYIKKEYGEKYVPEKPRFYKTKSKSAQEAHEAIRPTDVNSKPKIQNSKFGKDAERLYKLIWARFLACQMNPTIYDRTSIDVTASKYLLRASGQVIKFDGYLRVMRESTKSKSQNPKNGEVELPSVEEGEMLDLIKVNSEQKFTQPPARFNEASLIKTLEKLGIGRPSTYAPIITTIQIRQYVDKDERNFKPTPVGLAVNDFLLSNFDDVFEYDFTAELEADLDKVAQGSLKWTDRMKKLWKPLEKKLKDVEKNAKRVKIETEKLGRKCPECKKGELVIRVGRFGKFISCSTFPDCKYTEKFMEKIGKKCPDCKKGDVIVKKTRKGRKFFGCSRYPDCEFASWKDPKNEKTKKSG